MAAESYITQMMVIATLQSSSHRHNAELREVAITARGTDHKDYMFTVTVPNTVFMQLGEGNYIWAYVQPDGTIHSLQWTFPVSVHPTYAELHEIEVCVAAINLKGCKRPGTYMVQVTGETKDKATLFMIEFLANNEVARSVKSGESVTLHVDSSGTAHKITVGNDSLTVIHL